MTYPVARIGDHCTHGATVLTGTPDRIVNGIPTARLGDLVYCPLPGHGVNPIVSVLTEAITEGQPTAHVMAIAHCGAVIISGSTDTQTG